jgi:hypothetical protein
MNAYQCTCGQPLFFHNSRCLACGAEVAFDPYAGRLGALVPASDGTWSMAGDAQATTPRFRLCTHRTQAAACNWLVSAREPHAACLSCRLTRTIPDLSRPKNARRLAGIEDAKRRVLFGFMSCGLPVVPKADDDAAGLAFDLLEPLPDAPPVTTGHAGGVVTINVAEADDDYREMHRESLREPYRTVIGHLRHELGHYYWDRLVRDGAWLEPFRRLFGDERASYADALARHYRDGPPADWPQRFISSYAAAHPWEDWAETWAHYHHMRATLQTVASFGLATADTPFRITPFAPDVLYDRSAPSADALLEWVNAWVVLTAVLNETSRSMGQPDVYPFVLNRSVVTKMHFVQCVLDSLGVAAVPQAPATLATH